MAAQSYLPPLFPTSQAVFVFSWDVQGEGKREKGSAEEQRQEGRCTLTERSPPIKVIVPDTVFPWLPPMSIELCPCILLLRCRSFGNDLYRGHS